MAASNKKQQDKKRQAVDDRPSSRGTVAIIIGILIVLAGIAYFATSTRDNDDSSDQKEQSNTDAEEQSKRDEQAQKEADDAKIEEAKDAAASGQPVETVAVESDSQYRYVAGNGDSYTVLARQAIAQSDSGMTAAERVAAETMLTQDAGAPYLDIGEEVIIEKSAVKDVISWAKSLTSEQKSAWQFYADQVAW